MNLEPNPLWGSVHQILWEDWDPIGVRALGDWTDNEYDRYVWPVINKIVRGETADQVADYLDWASNENMECPQPRERNLALATKLVALKPSESC
jgi:hypothetical protein